MRDKMEIFTCEKFKESIRVILSIKNSSRREKYPAQRAPYRKNHYECGGSESSEAR